MDIHGREKAEKTKNTRAILVIILAVLVLVIGGGLIFYVNGISPADPDSKEKVTVTVAEGTGAQQALNQMDQAGLINSKFCAKVFVKLAHPAHIQANAYSFDKTMSLAEMIKAMEEGDFKYVVKSKFTLIEGATIPQAAAAIAKNFSFTKEEILAKWAEPAYLQSLIDQYWFLTEDVLNPDLKYPLEGYFYPETYLVPGEDASIEDLTKMMLDKMNEVLTARKKEIKEKLNMNIHQFLAFASVVERESLFDEDRAKIAGVFKNRLDKNMMLQSDISVLYALEETRVAVTYADLQVDSKYNTYKYPGVPVGPICAVPEKTMDDCINYEPSDAMFFFAKEDGTVIYSNTYAEHQKAVQENKWY